MNQAASYALGEEGEIGIAVTEGLGTFWLAPRLVEFQATWPGLLVNLACAMRPVRRDPLEREIIVQLFEPKRRNCKVTRAGRLHAMPFAAPGYIETHGLPRNLQELSGHRVVLQFADQTATREYYDRILPRLPGTDFVVTRTNTSSAHYSTIANGGGIGMLPTYAIAIGAQVIPIDIGITIPFDIWLVHHASSDRTPDVKRTIDWLVESFDAHRFPWFADDFIHPNELLKRYEGAPLVNLFDSLTPPRPSTTSIH